MKIAVFTRGVDRDFEWKLEDRFSDGESDAETRRKLKDYGISDQIKIDVPGVIIARVGDDFGVLLTGLATEHRRPAGGFVGASFAFFDLNEDIARKLATGVLLNWGDTVKQIVPSINRHGPPPVNPEWSFEVEQIEEFVKSTQLETVNPICDDRLFRPYAPPDNNGFAEYSRLVSRQIFSSENGIKVVISKSYPRNGEADFAFADIMILPDLKDQNLPKKKTFANHTRPNKSKEQSRKPSSVGNYPDRSGPSRSICWFTSNKELSTICVILLIGIVWAATCKKKAPESPVVKPETTGSATPAVKPSAGHKDLPPSTSEKKDPLQNPNEKSTIEADGDKKSAQEPEPVKP